VITDVARYARCDEIVGLEIVTAHWREHSFGPHMHDFYAVSLNEGGCGAFEHRREMREALPGTCNLIAPGEVHTGQAARGAFWRYRNLYIEPALMADLLHRIEWRGPTDVAFVAPVTDDPVLADRLAHAFASLLRASSRLERETLLLEVVAQLASNHLACDSGPRAVARRHPAVARARAWLDAHAEKDVSVWTLAQLVGLSPYHLVRTFHLHVGMPPHRYQTVLRVLRARRLLTSGVPIADVAHLTGFCDQSHLSRCFTQVLGTTPGRFRARERP
jgi:AraC-like DNA-binding protein